MPLYEYLCRDCDREVELLVRGAERPECPDCGSDALAKLLSVPASPIDATTVRGGADPPPGSCGTGCACFPGE